MKIRKNEIERLSVSLQPFDGVVAALEAAVGHRIWSIMKQPRRHGPSLNWRPRSKGPGPHRLDAVRAFDLGAILRKESGMDTLRIRLVIGNPLIMKEMAKHVPDAGSYAPVTILVDERPDGVHLTYDKMASLLAPYGNRDALNVARDLDSKIENLLRESAA